jgi:predicted nucleotidyltransferase
MVSRLEIQAFADEFARRFQPAKIILFGSQTDGIPTEDSDVDLIVIMPYRGSSAAAAIRIRLACPRSFPMDLIVRSPTEVRRRAYFGEGFVRQVISKGIILHESRNTSVG